MFQKNLRDIILGGQDGIVNVLGVVLGVSAATSDLKIIIVSGLAATFAESISMAAVAYTSTEAELSEYQKNLKSEKEDIKNDREGEVEDVRKVFRKWGFEADLLEKAVQKITETKERWASFMMQEELKLSKSQIEKPFYSAVVVGTSSLLGSFIPLLPFFFIKEVLASAYLALILSATTLFALGFLKAKKTVGNPLNSGIKMMAIGMASAVVGYIIGYILGGKNI
ncbi:hypothetical protein A2716_02010 [candidate division WWE3 bacterium RIFCSPHIGHO2_01_FULL_40_23]|uniref:Iron transporter n=1 Tax=candidate division WWE3 bacterium RIFCSPLOWO2_01_FULL_41_18 TaxID=1802625 RepID=A0A1F4VF30_UNCKA|nr:MAG: hypothetical protein A2716_02010 [candidate division WWE3 bacterium RIFCSPHIGHO2_01_FULL_40_23]OGC55765.1 MAG: hypothetical protein A3A78_01860 [candidate division WWE3 bacterium RIFCSPLOWO2_01_FULL_41_18]